MLTDMWSSLNLAARYSRYSIHVSGKYRAPQLGSENKTKAAKTIVERRRKSTTGSGAKRQNRTWYGTTAATIFDGARLPEQSEQQRQKAAVKHDKYSNSATPSRLARLN